MQQSTQEIDFQKIKDQFVETQIDTNIIEQSIIDFKNGRMGLIDGKLSDMCFKALKSSLPKSSGFIPVFSLENLNLCTSRYGLIKEYAAENFNNSQIKTNVLFVITQQRDDMQNMQALIESKRLIDKQSNGALIVYDESDNSTMIENWCLENDIVYTQEIEIALEKWMHT